MPTATTTRYWDCSGGACGCSYVPTGFENPADPAHCPSNALFRAPENNPHGASFYGAAAISRSLGGGDWMAPGCSQCWKVVGTSNADGFEGVTTTLVLKGTNFCPDDNPLCAAGPHFDIAAPGFDVIQFSLAHECPYLFPDEDFTACSTWLISSSDPAANCDCSKLSNPILRAGCENFFSLKWDNPVVEYTSVACPQELSRLLCGYPYPDESVNMPETCATNAFDAPAGTSPPTTHPEGPTPSGTPSPTTQSGTGQENCYLLCWLVACFQWLFGLFLGA